MPQNKIGNMLSMAVFGESVDDLKEENKKLKAELAKWKPARAKNGQFFNPKKGNKNESE